MPYSPSLPTWNEAMQLSEEDFKALLESLEAEHEAEVQERERLDYLSEGVSW